MWAQRLTGPFRFETVDVPAPTAKDVENGQVLLKFRAAAICGSDMPRFLGKVDPDMPWNGELGFPLHEIVGEVVESKAPEFRAGDRVVGIAERHRGLQEYFVNAARLLYPLDGSPLSDTDATVIQPMGTVFNAIARLPDPAGKRVAVIGLGPLGVLFCHALKSRGAKTVIGVDAVDRSDLASTFGVDQLVTSYARIWAEKLRGDERPEIIVEAVGHQQHTVVDAIHAIAPQGHIFAFGVPDDAYYALPFREMFRKNVSLYTGATTDWKRSLAESSEYLHKHRDLLARYVTNVFPVQRAAEAYMMYAQPKVGRLKVALTP